MCGIVGEMGRFDSESANHLLYLQLERGEEGGGRWQVAEMFSYLICASLTIMPRSLIEVSHCCNTALLVVGQDRRERGPPPDDNRAAAECVLFFSPIARPSHLRTGLRVKLLKKC